MKNRGTSVPKKDITEHQKERRRALQARHRATLSGLFDNLRKVVLPYSKKNPAKWKILHRAKSFLQQQEHRLSTLLSMKDDDDVPRSLEEVREQYRSSYPFGRQARQRCSGSGSGSAPDLSEVPGCSEEDTSRELGLSQASGLSVPNILEFEGYLLFYRQTVELLLHSGVLLPEQTSLPVVSEAISGLWESLPPERQAVFRSSSPWNSSPASHVLVPLDSQEVSGSAGSAGSTFEEDMLQDAYDVVQRELGSTTEERLDPEPLECGDLDKLREIYRDIMCFARDQVEEPESPQGLCFAVDYETVFLRCTETFDDDL